MAFGGDVTLAFAIDTTGSMSNEIGSAKTIAQDIVDWPRNKYVDYILSPFNDPATGPVSYCNSSQKSTFRDLIGKLRVHGGGDCKEMAIEGIQNIFTISIHSQSPIYVFTDAGAKDASEENVEMLMIMAENYQTSINFFLSNAGMYFIVSFPFLCFIYHLFSLRLLWEQVNNGLS